MASSCSKFQKSLVGGVALLGCATLGATSVHAGFDQIAVAPNSADYVKIENVVGHQVMPGDVVRVGDNGAMGFKLPDGSVFVIGDLHSTRTDVGGVELTKYTPARDGQGAVVEITMTEGNLAIDNTLAPDTRIIVRTRDSVVEIPPGSNTVCVTALPAGATKGQRTLTAVRGGEAMFANAGSTDTRRITSARAVASNGAGGQPRAINHPYNDCCGFLDDKLRAALSGPTGAQPGMGPVAMFSQTPAVAPAAGGVAQVPQAGGIGLSEIAIGAGAAAVVGAGIGLILGGGDDGAPTSVTTTTTTN